MTPFDEAVISCMYTWDRKRSHNSKYLDPLVHYIILEFNDQRELPLENKENCPRINEDCSNYTHFPISDVIMKTFSAAEARTLISESCLVLLEECCRKTVNYLYLLFQSAR